MLQSETYDPLKQDLFLYQDEVVTWTGGSATVKAPYAWNPNSLLYDYRRSLEGIRAPYRIFGTPGYAPGEPPFPPGSAKAQIEVNNPVVPANYPIWRNSWPPTSRMISKRLWLSCGHCYGTGNSPIRSQVSNLTLDDMYGGVGTYANAMSQMRFIDGDNNIVVLQKSLFEHPYDRDFDSELNQLQYVSGPYATDAYVSAYSQDFPFNPVVSIDVGSVPLNQNWYYLNAGNLVIQRIRAHGYGKTQVVSMNSHGMEIDRFYPFDYPYSHDSGSLFVTEIKPPSSIGAGDGVLGVALSHLVHGSGFDFFNLPRPRSSMAPLEPGIVWRDDQELAYFKQYWVNRGLPWPEPFVFQIPDSIPKVTKTQIENFAQTVATIRSTYFT